MPYEIRETDGRYCVHKQEDDERMGCHDTRDEAIAQLRAIEASEDDTKSTLVFFGDSVKALGDGRVGGYLVKFGNPREVDLVGDFFTKSTYFGNTQELDVYYQHGQDGKLKKRILTRARIENNEVGVWIEAQLKMRDEYERAIYELIKAGKMGWSSGTASHLMERKSIDSNAHEIIRWPLVEGSITPTPAEPRITATPLKSVIFSDVNLSEAHTSEDATASTGATSEQAVKSNIEVLDAKETKMSDEQKQTPQEAPQNQDYDALKSQISALSTKLEQAMKTIQDTPKIANSGYITQDGGTADPQIKTFGDFLVAVRRKDIKRLQSVYGSNYTKAQTEGTGSEGGYLVPDEYRAPIMEMVSMTSGVNMMVRRIPVGSPSGSIPMPNYAYVPTSADQTALGAGITTSARTEAGAYSAKSAGFVNINWLVTDFASGYVPISIELRNDAPLIDNIIQSLIAEANGAKTEYAILRGTGVNEPLGILNWAGTIDVTEDTDNTFAIADADEMKTRLLKRGVRYAWVVSPDVGAQLAGMTRNNGAAAWASDMPNAYPDTLLGYPVIESQHLPQIGTDGYAILADFSKYGMFERGAMYVDFSEHADFLNGNDVWRFGQRVDGKPLLTSFVTLANGLTQSPFVAIKNKT